MGRIVQVKDDNGRSYELDLDMNVVRGQGFEAETRAVLTQSDVNISSAMSSFVGGYGMNDRFAIADAVCPPVLVSQPSGQYHTWSSADLVNNVTNDVVAGDAEIKTVSPSLSSDSYSCVNYGLASFINNNVVAAADAPLDPRMAAYRRVMNAMAMKRELRVAALAQDTTTTFASYKTDLSSTTKWNGGTSSDPVSNLLTAIDSAMMPITDICLSQGSWHALIQNSNVQKFGLSNIGEKIMSMSPDEVASRLGLEGIKFHIGRMKYKNSSGTVTWIWGTACTLLHIPTGASIDEEEIPTLRTFRWNAPVGSNGFELREWEVPSKGQRGGRMVAVVTSEVQKAVAPVTGYVITGCVQ